MSDETATVDCHVEAYSAETGLRAAEAAAEALTGWQTMESAPKDGTPVRAALKVRSNTIHGAEADYWEEHVIWRDDETDAIHPDAYQGWDWDDYEFWKPIDTPDQPDHTAALLLALVAELTASLERERVLREAIKAFGRELNAMPTTGVTMDFNGNITGQIDANGRGQAIQIFNRRLAGALAAPDNRALGGSHD